MEEMNEKVNKEKNAIIGVRVKTTPQQQDIVKQHNKQKESSNQIMVIEKEAIPILL